jgi:hypothetical protein
MAMTEARRRAFGVTAMGGIGGVVKDHAKFSDIEADDHRILKNKGVTDEDFNGLEGRAARGLGQRQRHDADAGRHLPHERCRDRQGDRARNKIQKIKDARRRMQLDELATPRR